MALSIFHKRIITNIEDVSKFVLQYSDSDNIKGLKIGNTFFSTEQYYDLNKIFKQYHKILLKFCIPEWFFNFGDINSFFKSYIDLKKYCKREEEYENEKS